MQNEATKIEATTAVANPLQPFVMCCRCGVNKPYDDLNGTNILTGDNSEAYCRNIGECDSDEAREIMAEVASWL